MTEQQQTTSAPVEWFALTIECPDPGELADFYAAAFGGEVVHRAEDSAWVRTATLPMVFHRVESHTPTSWPSTDVPLHSHFEFVVRDPDVAAERMRRLGATVAQHQDPDDPHLVVMLDPAGNPFCLIRSSKARRP